MGRVGCIYSAYFRYYDIKSNTTKSKKRPFLIIKEEKSTRPIDLTVLPISTISHKNRINLDYDIVIEKSKYPDLNLNADICYIRTHKIQTINETELIDIISNDCRELYPKLYEEIKDKVNKYYKDILEG